MDNTVYMVMDGALPNVRRYWSGDAWVTDPSKALQHVQREGIEANYYHLIQGGTYAKLVRVNYTRTAHGYTIVGKIHLIHGVSPADE